MFRFWTVATFKFQRLGLSEIGTPRVSRFLSFHILGRSVFERLLQHLNGERAAKYPWKLSQFFILLRQHPVYLCYCKAYYTLRKMFVLSGFRIIFCLPWLQKKIFFRVN